MAFSFVNPFGTRDDPEPPEYEFGTNTGRQGTFNRQDPQQTAMAIRRLMELQADYGPRLSHNFSGETGLMPNDATGYSQMLNARTEASNIERQMQGSDPLRVKYGGVMAPAVRGLQRQEPMPQGHDEWTLRNAPHNRIVERYGRS